MKQTIALGDRHNGTSTCLVHEDGKVYVFKPRSAQTERAWSRFLERLSAAGLDSLPKCVEILTESENGHTEAVVVQHKTDAAGLHRYAKRCGVLLFLTYVLGSTDLHAENLIADGEYPVLVDLETLLYGIPMRNQLEQTLAVTVMHSFLLPHFVNGQELGGLTGSGEKTKNLPLCGRTPVKLWRYADEIIEGFEAAYRFGMAHKELLTEAVEEFSDCKFRFLMRPTNTYGKILHNLSLTPEEDRPALADRYLRRAYAKDEDPQWEKKSARILNAEISAVLNGDVPLFHVRGSRRDLLCGEETVMEDFLKCSPVDYAKRCISALSEEDMSRQEKLIDLSLCTVKPLGAPSVAQTADWMEQIGDALCAHEVAGQFCGFVRMSAEHSRLVTLLSAGFEFYYGLSGMLCCFAAFYAKSGEQKWLDLLNRYLTMLEDGLISRPFSTPLSDTSCGLSGGLGGMIAALLHVAELTGSKRAYEDAVTLAKKLNASQIEKCSADLLGGCGGICLSLPKLPQKIAAPIAEALLPVLTEAEPTLAGAAHGAAGQALALGALQTVLKTDEADEKILSLLRWENEQFDPKLWNWKDLRDPKKVGYMRGWCSGAPGIGMCRKKLLFYTQNEEIRRICREDIEKVKTFLLPPLPYPGASLCCGEASRVMAAACLGVSVEHKLSRIVCADAPELYHPLNTADASLSLMQGLAGIGYALAMQDDERCGGMLL